MTLSKAELKKLEGRIRKSKYTEKQREDAVRAYANGATLAAVAKEFGVPLPTIQNWVTRARMLAREAK